MQFITLFPEMVVCIVDNIIVKSLSMVMFVGWKDAFISLLGIGKKARFKEKGRLSIRNTDFVEKMI